MKCNMEIVAVKKKESLKNEMKRDIEDVCRTEKPFRREIMHSTVSTEKTSTYCGIDYKEKGRKHKNIIIALLRVPMGQLCFSLKKKPRKDELSAVIRYIYLYCSKPVLCFIKKILNLK